MGGIRETKDKGETAHPAVFSPTVAAAPGLAEHVPPAAGFLFCDLHLAKSQRNETKLNIYALCHGLQRKSRGGGWSGIEATPEKRFSMKGKMLRSFILALTLAVGCAGLCAQAGAPAVAPPASS